MIVGAQKQCNVFDRYYHHDRPKNERDNTNDIAMRYSEPMGRIKNGFHDVSGLVPMSPYTTPSTARLNTPRDSSFLVALFF